MNSEMNFETNCNRPGGPEEEEFLLGPEHACPSCGNYYSLCITAPPIPFPLSDYGTDEEIEEFEARYGNISQCSVCGWRSDDD